MPSLFLSAVLGLAVRGRGMWGNVSFPGDKIEIPEVIVL